MSHSKSIELKIIPRNTIKALLAHPEQSLIIPRTPDILTKLRSIHETLIFWTEQLKAPVTMTPDLACRILAATYPEQSMEITKGSPLPIITKATSLLLWFDPEDYEENAPDAAHMIQEDWQSGGGISFIKKGDNTLTGNIVIYDITEQKRIDGDTFTTGPEQRYAAIKDRITL